MTDCAVYHHNVYVTNNDSFKIQDVGPQRTASGAELDCLSGRVGVALGKRQQLAQVSLGLVKHGRTSLDMLELVLGQGKGPVQRQGQGQR